MKNTNSTNKKAEKITRKEAIKKGGKVAVLTAATMMMLLPSKDAAAQSTPEAPSRWTR